MMKKALKYEDDEMELELSGKVMKKTSIIQGFKLLFLNGDKSIHQVEVRRINFQDLMRHLQQGESILITPKLQKYFSVAMRKNEERAPWYFTHL
ncbi:MAG: hypothetical protein QXX59_00015 [Candidatus Bathyarchaeia archaeon]